MSKIKLSDSMMRRSAASLLMIVLSIMSACGGGSGGGSVNGGGNQSLALSSSPLTAMTFEILGLETNMALFVPETSYMAEWVGANGTVAAASSVLGVTDTSISIPTPEIPGGAYEVRVSIGGTIGLLDVVVTETVLTTSPMAIVSTRINDEMNDLVALDAQVQGLGLSSLELADFQAIRSEAEDHLNMTNAALQTASSAELHNLALWSVANENTAPATLTEILIPGRLQTASLLALRGGLAIGAGVYTISSGLSIFAANPIAGSLLIGVGAVAVYKGKKLFVEGARRTFRIVGEIVRSTLSQNEGELAGGNQDGTNSTLSLTDGIPQQLDFEADFVSVSDSDRSSTNSTLVDLVGAFDSAASLYSGLASAVTAVFGSPPPAIPSSPLATSVEPLDAAKLSINSWTNGTNVAFVFDGNTSEITATLYSGQMEASSIDVRYDEGGLGFIESPFPVEVDPAPQTTVRFWTDLWGTQNNWSTTFGVDIDIFDSSNQLVSTKRYWHACYRNGGPSFISAINEYTWVGGPPPGCSGSNLAVELAAGSYTYEIYHVYALPSPVGGQRAPWEPLGSGSFVLNVGDCHLEGPLPGNSVAVPFSTVQMLAANAGRSSMLSSIVSAAAGNP